MSSSARRGEASRTARCSFTVYGGGQMGVQSLVMSQAGRDSVQSPLPRRPCYPPREAQSLTDQDDWSERRLAAGHNSIKRGQAVVRAQCVKVARLGCLQQADWVGALIAWAAA
jgi:hypothetical protein